MSIYQKAKDIFIQRRSSDNSTFEEYPLIVTPNTTLTIDANNNLICSPANSISASYAKTASYAINSAWKLSGSNVYFNGNVGINQSSPQYSLDVSGSISNSSGNLTIQSSIPPEDGGEPAEIILYQPTSDGDVGCNLSIFAGTGGTNGGNINIQGGNGPGGDGTEGGSVIIEAGTSSGGNSGNIQLLNGYVGINQSSPQYTLDINGQIGNSNGTLQFNQNLGTNSGNSINIQSDNGNSNNGGQMSITAGTSYSGNAGIVSITAGSSYSGIAGDVDILAGGSNTNNAGNINITGGNGNNGGAVTITGGNGKITGGAVTITGGNSGLNGNNTGSNIIISSGQGSNGGTAPNGNIILYTNVSAFSNGYVGINQSSPQYTLDVSGSIHALGFLTPTSSSMIPHVTGSTFYSGSKLYIFTGTGNAGGLAGWQSASLGG